MRIGYFLETHTGVQYDFKPLLYRFFIFCKNFFSGFSNPDTRERARARDISLKHTQENSMILDLFYIDFLFFVKTFFLVFQILTHAGRRARAGYFLETHTGKTKIRTCLPGRASCLIFQIPVTSLGCQARYLSHRNARADPGAGTFRTLS